MVAISCEVQRFFFKIKFSNLASWNSNQEVSKQKKINSHMNENKRIECDCKICEVQKKIKNLGHETQIRKSQSKKKINSHMNEI